MRSPLDGRFARYTGAFGTRRFRCGSHAPPNSRSRKRGAAMLRATFSNEVPRMHNRTTSLLLNVGHAIDHMSS